jgi:alpha-L-fucosidase
MKTHFTRRKFLKTSALITGAGLTAPSWIPHAIAQPTAAPAYSIASGPFQPTWESLEQNYKLPDWYRDAKFGIWMHWGPQCQPGDGDWYAKYMYDQGRPQYEFHLKKYGHPSKVRLQGCDQHMEGGEVGSGGVCFSASKARARSFWSRWPIITTTSTISIPNISLGIRSTSGRKKTSSAPGQKLVRAAGMKFGVSVHGARAWNWYEDAQGSDKTGPLAGIPYDGKLTKTDGNGLWWDGLDPQDLYAQNHAIGAEPDAAYVTKYFNRIKDLIDGYHPDLIFFDDTKLPLGDAGLNLAAHFYNSPAASGTKGKLRPSSSPMVFPWPSSRRPSPTSNATCRWTC